MTPERWQRLKSLFDRAVALESSAQARFIQDAADGDPEMEASLRTLVGRHDSAATLLSGPIISSDRILEYLAAGVRTFHDGELLAGRFRIERFLAEGGMGEVYLAEDLELGERIALKTLRPSLSADEGLVQRFRAETQMARKVTHPNVCRVYDIFRHRTECDGASAGVAFLTMEFVDGPTLEDYLRDRGRLSAAEALALLRQIVHGLSAAHSVGIVHRDFKSGNILLSERNRDVRVVITDFGLARSLENSSSASGPNAVEGTLAYLAPEQLACGPFTPATDIYALGIVLFEILTGELPFAQARTWDDAMRLREHPPSARSRYPKVPASWDSAIAACMSPDPARRPSPVTEVLRRVAGGGLTRRRAAGLTVAGAFAVTAGAGAHYWLKAPPIPADALRTFKRGEDFAQRRNQDGLRNAVEEFQHAVTIYPRYVAAWVGMADAYAALANYDLMSPHDALARAKQAAARALSIDSRFAKAQGIYGRILSLDVHEWQTAEPYLRRAVALEPKDPALRLWYGAHLGKLGRGREALEQIDAGLEQSPSSMPLNHQLAAEYFWERRFPEFLNQARELIRLQPYEAGSHLVLARALEWVRRYDEALSACDEADRLKGSETGLCYRAAILAARGDVAQARKIAAGVRDYWSQKPFESALLAGLYAQLGGFSDAMSILNTGYNREDSTVLTVACNPYFDSYQSDERYRLFLRTIGWRFPAAG